MVVGVRQYGRWLRDNYADLEHKEVWQTYLVMLAFLPSTFFYSFFNVDRVFDFLLEVVNIPLIFILLWRVETLQDLEESAEGNDLAEDTAGDTDPIADKISTLLQQYCVEDKFYLRHDASLTLLVKLLGTNRSYLSQYFARQGHTYNTYINSLRIEHFERLYKEARNSQSDISASYLCSQCGFNNYSTFTRAFKKFKLMTLAEWMSKNS